MNRRPAALAFVILLGGMAVFGLMPAVHATNPFFFSTGNPDGKVATASSPSSSVSIGTETADDFILSSTTTITSATFVGLLPSGTALTGASRVIVGIYRVFPLDSVNPPSGSVITRVNSPSDNSFGQRDSAVAFALTYSATILNPSFTVANTVVNGINKLPNQFTGGEGPVTGEEVQFSVSFTTPFVLLAGHYFFVPQVHLDTGGVFLWLSAPKPIVPPGTPFTPDLQSWIRSTNLAPDWSRIGTDITHQGPFNAVFSLSGASSSVSGVPEFPIPAILAGAIAFAVIAVARRLRVHPFIS